MFLHPGRLGEWFWGFQQQNAVGNWRLSKCTQDQAADVHLEGVGRYFVDSLERVIATGW